MIRISVYAGHGQKGDLRETYSRCLIVNESVVSAELFRLGREYSNADDLPTRQVVITLDPVNPDLENRQAELKALVSRASELLERTELL